jgi:hypothetical protein
MSTDKSVSTGSDKSVSYGKPENHFHHKLADEQTKLPLRFFLKPLKKYIQLEEFKTHSRINLDFSVSQKNVKFCDIEKHWR